MVIFTTVLWFFLFHGENCMFYLIVKLHVLILNSPVRTQYNDTVGSKKIYQHIEFSSILNFIIHHAMTYLFTVVCTICICIYNKNVLCLFYHKHDIQYS